MQPTRHNTTPPEIASRVRQNAWSAAVAAACLLLFGFFAGFAIPIVTNLFTLGDAVFNYTLRFGGVLMVAVVIGSLSGWVTALLMDAVVSVAIGVLLAFSGVAMIVGGGVITLNYILYVIFGVMFVSSGIRNWREYFWLIPKIDCPVAPAPNRLSVDPTRSEDEAPSALLGSLLASQLRERMSIPRDDASTSPPQQAPTSAADQSSSVSAAPSNAHADTTVSPTQEEKRLSDDKTSTGEHSEQDGVPDPDGFLASFADEGQPPKI